jgi:serine protease Do
MIRKPRTWGQLVIRPNRVIEPEDGIVLRRTLGPVAVLAAVLALSATACSVQLGAKDRANGSGAQTQGLPPLPAGGEDVAAVVQRVLPAVVNVTTDVFRTDPFGNAQQGRGVGTGFIVRSDGVIVTNCHVVEGASRITVFTSASHPDKYNARLIGADCLNDIAVLKVDATELPTVRLGDSSGLRLGQQVVALGYALALEGGPTVTDGIVSSLDRTITAQDPGCDVCPNNTRTYSNAIQTDAAINHGNSGGPLVDMRGRVVGMNSAGTDSAENIGFAIPIDAAKQTITSAITDPLAPAAYLGVSTQPVTADMAFQLGLPVDSGAYVLGTTTDGPAAGAGIKEGDVIVRIGDRQIGGADDVGAMLGTLHPGDPVTIELVNHDGGRRTITVTLGTRPLPVDIP